MAILQKIRNKGGIFVMFFVGVALFLFIIDPSTFNSMFHSNPTDIAKINGNKIKYERYHEISTEHEEFLKLSQNTSSLDQETSDRVRQQTWNDILLENIQEATYNDLGIVVSEEELEDMLWGRNISAIIQGNFTNPNTGMIDTAFIKQYFQNAYRDETGTQTFIANYLKKAIVSDRLSNKFNTLIAKGLYVPVFVAKDDYFSKNDKVDFNFVALSYKDIDDSEVNISDADIENYYKKHIERYQVEEDNRDIEFVIFNIVASAEDSLSAKTEIIRNADEFASIDAEDIPRYVTRYSDSAYVKKYYELDEFGFLTGFDENSKIGDVSEMYENMGAYWYARIMDIDILPDSVRASHILLQPDSTRNLERVNEIADSLMLVAKRGTDFGMLAMLHSDDQGSKMQGGDIDWFTAESPIVDEFKEACLKGKKGDVVVVESMFGVHVIKITDQTKPYKKYSLAFLTTNIKYSNASAQQVYAEASVFSAENLTAELFDKACAEQMLTKRIASEIKENDFHISGLDNPREIVKWAFKKEVDEGSVSGVFELQDKYIVAKLTSVRNKGNAKIEDVRDQIKPYIIAEKKAEKLIQDLSNDVNAGMNLEAIATKYNRPIDDASNISLNTFSIPAYGVEPNVIAHATVIEQGKVSKPIKGNNGVYVIMVTNSIAAPEKTEFDTDQISLMRSLSSRASYQTWEAMLKSSDIKDNRSTFF